MSNLPVYYYKSTILTVDDDKLFSQALAKILGSEFIVKQFDEPAALIEYAKHYEAPSSRQLALQDCSVHDEYDTAHHALVDLDVPSLYSNQKNAERHQEISVVIMDYDMPSMSGLDVCAQITALKAKKILLTGTTDQQIAINAFNHNLIDRFIPKHSTDVGTTIKNFTTMLARQYYLDLTKPMISHLEASKPSPLSDDKFANFFHQWCQENAIKEFTMIDKSGSFSVINDQQQEYYFILHSENSLNAFIALNDDVTDVTAHLAAIKAREMIPFFGVGVDSWEVEPADWNKYCYPANHFIGRENYYWAVTA